jgi:DNA mismatch endonuclease, patch repair protein
MRRVRQKHTAPELILRKWLFAKGFRFRLHSNTLPGSPDITLAKYETAIFVHGCFWHGHDCDHGSRVPASNTQFWLSKIEANRQRDARKERALRQAGWKVLVVWECDIKTGRALNRVEANLKKRPRPER